MGEARVSNVAEARLFFKFLSVCFNGAGSLRVAQIGRPEHLTQQIAHVVRLQIRIYDFLSQKHMMFINVEEKYTLLCLLNQQNKCDE